MIVCIVIIRDGLENHYFAGVGSGGTGLFLARTHVYGHVQTLRSLPGLGSSWGSQADHFSSCEAWAAPTSMGVQVGSSGSSAEAEGLFACMDEHPRPLGCELSHYCQLISFAAVRTLTLYLHGTSILR